LSTKLQRQEEVSRSNGHKDKESPCVLLITSNGLYEKWKYPPVRYIGPNRGAGARLPKQSEKPQLRQANRVVGSILESN